MFQFFSKANWFSTGRRKSPPSDLRHHGGRSGPGPPAQVQHQRQPNEICAVRKTSQRGATRLVGFRHVRQTSLVRFFPTCPRDTFFCPIPLQFLIGLTYGLSNESINTEGITWCACLMSGLYRIVAKTPQNFQSEANANWMAPFFSSQLKKEPNNIIFGSRISTQFHWTSTSSTFQAWALKKIFGSVCKTVWSIKLKTIVLFVQLACPTNKGCGIGTEISGSGSIHSRFRLQPNCSAASSTAISFKNKKILPKAKSCYVCMASKSSAQNRHFYTRWWSFKFDSKVSPSMLSTQKLLLFRFPISSVVVGVCSKTPYSTKKTCFR